MLTVTRIRQIDTGEVDDRYGKPIFAESRTEHTALEFAPKVAGEVKSTEQVLSSDGGTLFFETGSIDTVLTDDRFIVRGIEYEVDGEDTDWHHAFSDWNPGLLVVLKRSEYVHG